MGYGYYTIGSRPAGYLVIATCDKRGCDAKIDRGMGYVCGEVGEWTGSGCGRYFCPDHLGGVGPHGGCPHRGAKAWGRVLSDLVPNEDGSIVCCDPLGHDGPHAWEVTDA